MLLQFFRKVRIGHLGVLQFRLDEGGRAIPFAAIAVFVNEVKGKSMLALSCDLGVQYKIAFVLAHKIREAMASKLKGMQVGGEGKTVEADGGYFGGYVKPANHKENRRDRRLAKNQNRKRRVVVVVRQRDGRTLPAMFRTEAAATAWIASRVRKGTSIMADEAGSWNDLHAKYEVSRAHRPRPTLQHRRRGLYERGRILFQPMRRAEIGHHHHIAGQ